MSTEHPSHPQLSSRVRSLPSALSVYINQLVYDLRRIGRDVITLSLGEAFFDISQQPFGALDFVKGYHYSDSQGLPDLRKRIASYYSSRYGAQVSPDAIIVSAGSKVLTYMIMQATLDHGDTVVLHEPAWLSYREQARLCGAKVLSIPHDFDIASFQSYIPPSTRLLIINNPNNPAGRVYDTKSLIQILEICRSLGIYLLVDEAYSDFAPKNTFASLAALFPSLEGAIVVNSLSKNMGMSGWRVGYAISNEPTVEALLKLNQHLITCAPTILQMYLAKYFDQILSETLPQVSTLVDKRRRVALMLRHHGLSHLNGEATFYFFIDVSQIAPHTFDLALYLLLFHDIAVVPGEAYGDSTRHFVRLSIGTESEDRIEQAVQVLKQLVTDGFDRYKVLEELNRLSLPIFDAGSSNVNR